MRQTTPEVRDENFSLIGAMVNGSSHQQQGREGRDLKRSKHTAYTPIVR